MALFIRHDTRYNARCLLQQPIRHTATPLSPSTIMLLLLLLSPDVAIFATIFDDAAAAVAAFRRFYFSLPLRMLCRHAATVAAVNQ